MNPKLIQDITKEIYRRFPEVSGKKPKVQVRKPPKARSIARAPTYLLIFRSQVKTSTNKTLPYYVRVVVSEKGKILKITMSR